MGLDQSAYVAARAGQMDDYWNAYQGENEPNPVEKPRELAYWRKHPSLQGWMERLWRQRNPDDPRSFNGIELELTLDDLNDLEAAVNAGALPETSGFFFGNDSSEYYREHDIQFIRAARADLFCGLRVFYNSSW